MLYRSLTWLFLFASSSVMSCGDRDTSRHFPVTLGLYTNIVGVPVSVRTILPRFPLHPGMYAGTELHFRKRARAHWFINPGLAVYVISQLHRGIILNTATGKRRYWFKGLFSEAALCFGYLHTFNYGPMYRFDEAKGYVKKRDWGRPHIAPGLQIALGYRLAGVRHPAVFMMYQFQPEYPFTIRGKIPLLPHLNVYVGTRFNLRK